MNDKKEIIDYDREEDCETEKFSEKITSSLPLHCLPSWDTLYSVSHFVWLKNYAMDRSKGEWLQCNFVFFEIFFASTWACKWTVHASMRSIMWRVVHVFFLTILFYFIQKEKQHTLIWQMLKKRMFLKWMVLRSILWTGSFKFVQFFKQVNGISTRWNENSIYTRLVCLFCRL